MGDFGLKSIEALDYHRNGVGGRGFYVGIFKTVKGERYLAIRTNDADGVGCFVLDLDKAHAGNIAFGSNSWRGDVFIDEASRLVKHEGSIADKYDREAWTYGYGRQEDKD
jgi:hypothetical protein